VSEPTTPDHLRRAVYRIFDATGRLLYVGLSKSPKTRVRCHRRTKAWGPEIAHHTVEWHRNPYAAHTAETAAIRAEQPIHNQVSTPAYRAKQSAIQQANSETQRIKCRDAYLARKARLAAECS
jgi:excinuclease UvrABC nuclease subunit